MSKQQLISPIAIDLGAKNTGVYFAHYPAGSPLDRIEKAGKVYQLDSQGYTYLMANRTAARHQRRGYDRRQMAKRLFKLVWCEHFGLKWNKDVQQAIGFLLNRRGFSFLAPEYEAEVLARFPKEAFDKLPDDLKKIRQNADGDYDFAGALTEWANEGEAKVKSLYESINKEPKRLRARLFVVFQTEKLRDYCSLRKGGNKIPEEKRATLSRLSKWVLDEWVKDGVQGLPAVPAENTVDLVEYLNNLGTAASDEILCSLPSKQNLAQEKSELNKSNWNFETEKFQTDKVNLDDSENPDIKTHLHHLAFAFHKVHGELRSGGRHRSKYFEEVKNVLERKDHTHGYLKGFCGNLQSGHFRGLTVNGMSNLLGHISNLELKPLRKYFNDEKHKGGDYWDESRIARLVDRWMLREWRVGEKDKDKADNGKWSYLELKGRWNQRGGSIVDFWLDVHPEYTIPPYQDNNNRRPPKCQSLLLNVGFLNRKYGGWRKWLGELKGVAGVRDHLGDYEEKLKELKSGSGKCYFSDERAGNPLVDSGRRSMAELDARVLQFILDRVKAEDGLNLNEIYSHAKKIRQDRHKRDDQSVKDVALAKAGLEKAIEESELHRGLKVDPDYDKADLFPQGGFLHLVCKYYKLRQRARDGRIFIHPEYRHTKARGHENTGRFDDKDHLLTYCNHKPRQKRYQMLGDLAGVLQVSPHELERVAGEHAGETTDDKLFNWLCGIHGLRANCDRAAKEQKDRRGRLKLDIQTVFGLIRHRKQTESPPPKEVRQILKSSKINSAQALHDFCERARQVCVALTESLYGDSKQQAWQKELDKNPATAVYLLAQINNIAFKERNGNANTCAVCSMDNATRMQMVSAANGKDATAKAQRLPAIPTRLIDGAVMRMARIVGGAIARDKWEKVADELATGKHVCVPIIIESNQFEFEPSKDELVKSQRTKPRKGKPLERGGELKIAASKDERIRAAGHGVCPYTGDGVPEGVGDKDHIIPRSSRWGTLNDEANLIWASERGNKEVKKDREFSLANLKGAYKRAVFGEKSDDQIKEWIIEQIVDGFGEDFDFGKYRSFINLTPEQQTAFRHALFLEKGDPLRERVIAAIDNKNRAFVNGTQRYFAEVLANQLYKLAKSEGKERQLSFDYFGVEAKPNSAGDSIYDLRKLHEEYDPKIAGYAKSKDSKQQAYSHLIDAQLAFVIVVDAHRGEGGLKLRIDDAVGKAPYREETGEIDGGLLGAVRVSDDDFELESLGRRKAYDVETHHRELLNNGNKNAVHVSYRIHRSNLIAEKFMPLIRLESGEFRKGFSAENSVEYKSGDFEMLEGFLRASNTNQNVWLVKKSDALNFLMDAGRHGLDAAGQKVAKLLDGLAYQTCKKPVSSVLTPPRSAEPQTVSDALKNWDACIDEAKFKKSGVVLPVFGEWNKLKAELEDAAPEQSLQVFLQNSKTFSDKHGSSIRNHNKRRKVYSLPVIATIGSIRLQRRAWSGQNVIQTAAEESIARYGLDSKQRPHTVLSKNSIPVKHYSGIPETLRPEPSEWKEIPEESIAKHNGDDGIRILSGKVKYKDAGRSTVLLKVDDIQNLSLPQDKKNWKGKLFRHESVGVLEGRVANEKGDNIHCLSSEWQWFSAPFRLPEDRNEVTVKNVGGVYELEFTVQKTAEIKRWLLS